MIPNQDQVAGVLRIVVPAVCTWLSVKGFSVLGDASIVAQITSLCIGLAAVAWSIVSHTASAKIAAAANVDPGIQIQLPGHLAANDSKIKTLVDNQDAYRNVTSKS